MGPSRDTFPQLPSDGMLCTPLQLTLRPAHVDVRLAYRRSAVETRCAQLPEHTSCADRASGRYFWKLWDDDRWFLCATRFSTRQVPLWESAWSTTLPVHSDGTRRREDISQNVWWQSWRLTPSRCHFESHGAHQYNHYSSTDCMHLPSNGCTWNLNHSWGGGPHTLGRTVYLKSTSSFTFDLHTLYIHTIFTATINKQNNLQVTIAPMYAPPPVCLGAGYSGGHALCITLK